VLNRAVGRRTLFASAADYEAFVETVAEALRTRPMRICGYCVMPNHWHMVLWPEHDGDLSAFVQHFTNLHVKRWKLAHHEVGHGHLYQGRFKSFPIQTDDSFHTVVRYVERNPLRANLVARAEAWPCRAWDRRRPPNQFPSPDGPYRRLPKDSARNGLSGSISRKPRANSPGCNPARVAGSRSVNKAG